MKNMIKELWHGNIIPQQPNKLAGNEGTTRIHGKASRGSRKELHGRAERNLRKVPRLLERVYEPRRSSHLRICLPPWSKVVHRGAKRQRRITNQASEKKPMPDFLKYHGKPQKHLKNSQCYTAFSIFSVVMRILCCILLA